MSGSVAAPVGGRAQRDAHGDATTGVAAPQVTVGRYSVFTRINHWTLAICFILLSLTGLALFHPSLFWLSTFFGGGPALRALHPWIGVVMIVAWLVMFVRFFAANLPEKVDFVWASKIADVLSGREENLPEVGKYNAGQKMVFWSFSLLVPGLFLTGLAIWDQYFYDRTSIPQKRFAVLAHAILAIGMITVWIVHAYAAIWVRGTIQAMTRGHVSGGWAWRHHRKWLRELVGGKRAA